MTTQEQPLGYPAKRLLDLTASAAGLVVLSPVLIAAMIAVWAQDWHSPFYRGKRVGLFGQPFEMLKLRSMVVNADQSGVNSTAGTDRRITAVGQAIRRYKLDEVTQLWNVLKGEMSLVGPRPQVASDVAFYGPEERKLLLCRPGITDFSSIVFSDEGAILAGSQNADLDYGRLIRPWKLKLALLYADHASLGLDMKLIAATLVAIVSKKRALAMVNHLLIGTGAGADLIEVSRRQRPLVPQPLPEAMARAFGAE